MGKETDHFRQLESTAAKSVRARRRSLISVVAIAAILIGVSGLAAVPAFAVPMVDDPAIVTAGGIGYPASNFSVDDSAKVITLTADYGTSTGIFIPQGYTLDGAGHTIFLADPTTGPFLGAAVQNATSATDFAVRNLTIDGTAGLVTRNATGTKNLFGIRFLNASGSVSNSTVLGIARGAYVTTNEGSGITANNLGGATARTVSVTGVTVSRFQKSAVNFTGNVGGTISGNTLGSGAAIIAPNTIALQTGASASIIGNTLGSEAGTNGYTGTGMLLYGNRASLVKGNTISGNAQYGIDAEDAPGYPMGTTTVVGNTISTSTTTAASVGAGIYVSSAHGALQQRYNTTAGYDQPLQDGLSNGALQELPIGVAQPVTVSANALVLHAEWAAATGASSLLPTTGYVLTVLSGTTVVASKSTTELSADVTVAAGDYTVSVAPTDDYGLGAAAVSSAVSAIAAIIPPVEVESPPVVTSPTEVAPVVPATVVPATVVPATIVPATVVPVASVPVLADWVATDVGTDTADLLSRYAAANSGDVPPTAASFLTFAGVIPFGVGGTFDSSIPFTATAPWAGSVDSWVDVWAYSTPTFVGTFPVVDGVLQIAGADLSSLKDGSHHLVFVGQTSRTQQVVSLSVGPPAVTATTTAPSEKPTVKPRAAASADVSNAGWALWLLVVVVVVVLGAVFMVTRIRRHHTDG